MNDKKLQIDCNLEIEHFGRKINITTPETDHLEINFKTFSTFQKFSLNNYSAHLSQNLISANKIMHRNQTIADVKIGRVTILKLGEKKTLKLNYPAILIKSLISIFR